MPDTALNAHQVEHPAPRRGPLGRWLLVAALFGAPIAWFVQLAVNYAVASHACFPSHAPDDVAIPGRGWLPAVALTIDIVALGLAAAGTILSIVMWRRARADVRSIEAGEGRTRFLAVWAMWFGAWFVLSVAFNLTAVLEVPVCS
jgi:hypothetical protein